MEPKRSKTLKGEKVDSLCAREPTKSDIYIYTHNITSVQMLLQASFAPFVLGGEASHC